MIKVFIKHHEVEYLKLKLEKGEKSILDKQLLEKFSKSKDTNEEGGKDLHATMIAKLDKIIEKVFPVEENPRDTQE